MRRLFLVLALLLWPVSAWAEGNLAKRAERLPVLEINGAEGFSVTKYEIETGKFYRWRIASDGRGEYKLLAPELMRNSWVDQISIEDKEVRFAERDRREKRRTIVFSQKEKVDDDVTRRVHDPLRASSA